MRAALFLSFLLATTCTGFAPAFAGPAAAVVPAASAAARAPSSGACYAIQDADARTHCLARARRDASQCYAIQTADRRAECLAEVRR